MKYFSITFFAIALWGFKLTAQGCSDAGFCTIDSYSTEAKDSSKTTKNLIKIGFGYGGADHNIAIISNNINYKRTFNDQWALNLKLNSIVQSGDLYTNIGVSDLFVTGSYKPIKDLSIGFGIKVPLSNAGNANNGLPLPMDYQSSTGTFDGIITLGYKFKGLRLTLGYQQPLNQNNNDFNPALYDSTSGFRSFINTRQFHRQADIMLRVAYIFKLGKHFEISPSLLPIYHLGQDSYLNDLDERVAIEGSEGLTFNGNLFFSYKFKEAHSIQLGYSTPFVVRKKRPDGLTRSYIVSLEYSFKF